MHDGLSGPMRGTDLHFWCADFVVQYTVNETDF